MNTLDGVADDAAAIDRPSGLHIGDPVFDAAPEANTTPCKNRSRIHKCLILQVL